MNISLQLYSVYHKPFFIPHAAYVTPIQAGKALSNLDLKILADNTGDNISQLNDTFCELTVKYWIWKNAARSTTHWGLCHYRRYFMQNPSIYIKAPRLKDFPATQDAIDEVLNDRLYDKITSLLQRHDVIVQQPMYIHKNKQGLLDLQQHYEKDHIPSDWEAVMRAIKKLYPEYEKSLGVFNHSYKMSFFNMMIAPWKTWDDYLEWLFAILFEVKANIKVSDDAYQSRVFGFMSERLINLYLLHNQLNTAYLPVAVFK
jgi:hypothetical protein